MSMSAYIDERRGIMDSIGLKAEEYRRSHCDRKEALHECVGKVTLQPGLMLLDCSLCGAVAEDMRSNMVACNTAFNIAKVFKIDWSLVSEESKRQVFIELRSLVLSQCFKE